MNKFLYEIILIKRGCSLKLVLDREGEFAESAIQTRLEHFFIKARMNTFYKFNANVWQSVSTTHTLYDVGKRCRHRRKQVKLKKESTQYFVSLSDIMKDIH